MERKKHKIDASGQSLGRLAVAIATILRGKDSPDFELNKDIGGFVLVENARKMRVTGKKADQKVYYRHSGYPGGLKKTTYRDLFEKDPQEVLKKAVFGMLPKNKLRDRMIKRLKVVR